MRPDPRRSVTTPCILAFDTSAAQCAAGLLVGDRVILRSEDMQKGQAERLLPLLQDLLAEGGVGWVDLTALAVGTGPGNFTGVRIAVAAARGLALGLGIPAIGVTRLEAVAYGLPRPISVIEDARRDQVYVQGFADDAEPARLADAVAVGPLYALRTGSAAGPGALPSAVALVEAIARIAASREHSPRPAPFYLRGADAAPPSDPPPTILLDPVGA